MAKKPIYADALNSLLNDMPRLLLQQQMESARIEAQKGREEKSDLRYEEEKKRQANIDDITRKQKVFQAIKETNMNKMQPLIDDVRNNENRLIKLKDEMNALGVELPQRDDKNPDATGALEEKFPEIARQLNASQQAVIQGNIDRLNDLNSQNEKMSKDISFLTDVKRTLTSMKIDAAQNITPDLYQIESDPQSQYVTTAEDYETYFDIKYGDKYGDPEDPMSDYYYNAFVSFAPGIAEQEEQLKVSKRDQLNLAEFREKLTKDFEETYQATMNASVFGLSGKVEIKESIWDGEASDFTRDFKKTSNYEMAREVVADKEYAGAKYDDLDGSQQDEIDSRIASILFSNMIPGREVSKMERLMNLTKGKRAKGSAVEVDVMASLLGADWLALEATYRDLFSRSMSSPEAMFTTRKSPAIPVTETALDKSLDQLIEDAANENK